MATGRETKKIFPPQIEERVIVLDKQTDNDKTWGQLKRETNNFKQNKEAELVFVQDGMVAAFEGGFPAEGAYSKEWMQVKFLLWKEDYEQLRERPFPLKLQDRFTDNVSENAGEKRPVSVWTLKPDDKVNGADEISRLFIKMASKSFRDYCATEVAIEEISLDDKTTVSGSGDEVVIHILEENEEDHNPGGYDNLPPLQPEIDPNETAADLIMRSYNGEELLETRWGVGTWKDLLCRDQRPFDREEYYKNRARLGGIIEKLKEKYKLEGEYEEVPFSLCEIGHYAENKTQLVSGIMVEPHRQTTHKEYKDFLAKVAKEIEEGEYN